MRRPPRAQPCRTRHAHYTVEPLPLQRQQCKSQAPAAFTHAAPRRCRSFPHPKCKPHTASHRAGPPGHVASRCVFELVDDQEHRQGEGARHHQRAATSKRKREYFRTLSSLQTEQCKAPPLAYSTHPRRTCCCHELNTCSSHPKSKPKPPALGGRF